MNTASAPGKIILFGEHAVVYGRPALAVPVTQVRATVDVWPAEYRGVWIEAPNIRIKAELREIPTDHALAAALQILFSALGIDPYPNINIRITSTIPVASGLGSGAAVTVALTRALASHLRRAMKDEDVNAFVYEIEKIHHGTPSGIVTFKTAEAIRAGHPPDADHLFIVEHPPVLTVGVRGDGGRSHILATPARLEQLGVTVEGGPRWTNPGSAGLAITGVLPLNLGLEGVDERVSDRPMNLRIRSTGVQMSILDPLLPTFNELSGIMQCDMTVGGTLRHPTGFHVVTGGGQRQGDPGLGHGLSPKFRICSAC